MDQVPAVLKVVPNVAIRTLPSPTKNGHIDDLISPCGNMWPYALANAFVASPDGTQYPRESGQVGQLSATFRHLVSAQSYRQLRGIIEEKTGVSIPHYSSVESYSVVLVRVRSVNDLGPYGSWLRCYSYVNGRLAPVDLRQWRGGIFQLNMILLDGRSVKLEELSVRPGPHIFPEADGLTSVPGLTMGLTVLLNTKLRVGGWQMLGNICSNIGRNSGSLYVQSMDVTGKWWSPQVKGNSECGWRLTTDFADDHAYMRDGNSVRPVVVWTKPERTCCFESEWPGVAGLGLPAGAWGKGAVVTHISSTGAGANEGPTYFYPEYLVPSRYIQAEDAPPLGHWGGFCYPVGLAARIVPIICYWDPRNLLRATQTAILVVPVLLGFLTAYLEKRSFIEVLQWISEPISNAWTSPANLNEPYPILRLLIVQVCGVGMVVAGVSVYYSITDNFDSEKWGEYVLEMYVFLFAFIMTPAAAAYSLGWEVGIERIATGAKLITIPAILDTIQFMIYFVEDMGNDELTQTQLCVSSGCNAIALLMTIRIFWVGHRAILAVNRARESPIGVLSLVGSGHHGCLIMTGPNSVPNEIKSFFEKRGQIGTLSSVWECAIRVPRGLEITASSSGVAVVHCREGSNADRRYGKWHTISNVEGAVQCGAGNCSSRDPSLHNDGLFGMIVVESGNHEFPVCNSQASTRRK